MSDIIETLLDDRRLNLRERTALLLAEAAPGLQDLVERRRLNWRETPILLVVALADEDDFPGGATVVDIAEVLKQRSSDVAKEILWLRHKGLVEDDEVEDDPDIRATRWWLTEDTEGQIAAPPAGLLPPGVDPGEVEFTATRRAR